VRNATARGESVSPQSLSALHAVLDFVLLSTSCVHRHGAAGCTFPREPAIAFRSGSSPVAIPQRLPTRHHSAARDGNGGTTMAMDSAKTPLLAEATEGRLVAFVGAGVSTIAPTCLPS